ncbi:RecF/RecN/SMC N terminal domain-containing protein, partial [Toxoplasma gondii ARI]
IRERVEASKLEQQRLSREAAAASGRQRQQTMESMQILRQADQQGMRVPLAAGTWRNVRMWVYREEKRRAFLDSSSEDEEPQSVDAPSEERGHSKKSKDAAESPRRTGDIAGRRRSDASERDAPEGEGTGEGEVRDRRREQERPDEDEKLFVIDFSKLAAEKREFISQHKDTPARLLEAAATQEAELLRRGAHLRSLFPNLKVGEKEKKTREQLTEISAELERVQRVSRAAAARLADLQRERNARFAVCFHHCRVAVDVFFRELTTTTFGKDAGLDDATSGFAKVGGRAYLDLERPRGDREDDAFAGGVSLLCMPPGKRLLPLHLLSGGERLVAALSLVLALLSFTPHLPFLLFDEVDAPLDAHRRQALARLLRRLPSQAGLQVLFISLKDKMFSTADLLVGVAKAPRLGCSRCFFLDLLPYRSRPSLSSRSRRIATDAENEEDSSLQREGAKHLVASENAE